MYHVYLMLIELQFGIEPNDLANMKSERSIINQLKLYFSGAKTGRKCS